VQVKRAVRLVAVALGCHKTRKIFTCHGIWRDLCGPNETCLTCRRRHIHPGLSAMKNDESEPRKPKQKIPKNCISHRWSKCRWRRITYPENKYLFAQILFCFPPNLFGLAKRSKLYRQTFYGTNFTVYPYLWLNINTRKLFISLHVTSISCWLLLNNKRKCFQLIICRRQVHENLKVSRKIQLWRRYHLNKSKRTPKNVGERSKQGLSICRCSIDIWAKYRLAISGSSWRGKEL